MSETLHVQVSELSGGMPDVPFAPGVDRSALVAGDSDPVFLTLPLLSPCVSRNQRRYDGTAVNALVEQINSKKPGGILGHLSTQDRATRFDLPSLMWVGAMVDATGKAWGKAYIPQYASDVREYVLKSKARRAAVATSIYGTADVDKSGKVRNLIIESLDLADPARAGVDDAVAEPHITREQVDEDNNPMSEELIGELRGQRDRVQEQLNAAQTQVAELQTRIQELETNQQTMTALREILPQGDLVQAVREMQTVVQTISEQQRQAQINEAVTAALGEIANNERGATLIREMVGTVENAEAATARVQELLAKDHVKAMLQALVAQPGVIVGEQKDGDNYKDAAVKNAAELAAKYGLNLR